MYPPDYGIENFISQDLNPQNSQEQRYLYGTSHLILQTYMTLKRGRILTALVTLHTLPSVT